MDHRHVFHPRRTAALLLFLLGTAGLWAQTFAVGGNYAFIAPNPIPWTASAGSPGVGIIQLAISCNGANGIIDSIELTRNGSDTLGTAWVRTGTTGPFNIRGYLSQVATWNAPSVAGGNQGEFIINGVTTTATTITIDVSTTKPGISKNQTKILYLAFDLPNTITTPKIVSYNVSKIMYGTNSAPGSKTFIPTPALTASSTLNDYRVSFSAAGVVTNAYEQQGNSFIPVLRLTFGGAGDEAATKHLSTIALQSLGQRDADVPSGGVSLYLDTNNNDLYDSGIDTFVASTAISGGVATIGPITVPTAAAQFSTTAKNYLVLASVDANAVADNTIGFKVVNPSTAVVCADAAMDANANVIGEYAQTGYLTAAAETPLASRTFLVATRVPFIVSGTVPANGAAGVLRGSSITVEFSADVDPATLVYGTTVLLKDSALSLVPAAVTYDSGTKTATIDPAGSLAWGETYTVSVTTGVENLASGAPLDQPKNWSFSVEPAIHPTVSVTSPLNNDTGVVRGANVTATFSKDMDNATINSSSFTVSGSVSGAHAGAVGYDGGSRTATFDPTVDFNYGELVTATLTTAVADTVGLPLQAAKVWTFTVDAGSTPVVTVTDPANGATEVPRTNNLSATFSLDMEAATLTAAGTFTLKDHLGNSLAGTVGYDAGTRTATFDPTPTLLWGETYTATITTAARAAAGAGGQNMVANKIWSFTTTTPVYPTVATTSPAAGASEVSRATAVSAVFSKDMTAATLTAAGTFTLKDHLGNSLAGTVGYDAASYTATFDPTPTLLWGETYTATITTAAQSTDGLALQANKVWTFTTTMPVYPVVSSTVPAPGAGEVPRADSLTAVFSKTMNGATITAAGTFTLKDHLNNDVAGTVSYDAGTQTATFDPTPTLLWGETYSATITTAATDTDGLALQANKVWTFTTTMPVYPVVSTTSPVNGASGVLVGADITATFSKDMDGATITDATFTLSGTASGPITGTVSYDPGGRTATFSHGGDLFTWGETVTATISTVVADSVGLHLQANKIWSFTVEAGAYPMAISTTPANTDVEVPRSSNISAVFSTDMDPATISTDNFIVKDHLNNVVPGVVTYSAATYTATFNPASDLLWGENYTATITTGVMALGSGNNMLSNKNWIFTTALPISPIVTVTSPVNGTSEVSRAATVTATFSKDMNGATITAAGTFTLKDHLSTDVPGTVSYDAGSQTATFTPGASLAWGETYTATVSTAATDTSGLSLQANRIWTFATTTPVYPMVLNTTPVNGEAGITRSATVQAVFSENVNGVDAAGVFTLKDHLNNNVAGSVGYDPGSRTATFTPGASLLWGETYTATVSTAVTDDDGLHPLTAKTWSFTTVIAVYPQVLNTTPLNLETAVSRSATVQAVFSKDVNGVDAAGVFTLKDHLNNNVAGSVAYNGTTFTATFTPGASLLWGETYTATVSTAVTDDDGLHPLTAKTWSFTTLPAVYPVVSTTSPQNTANEVPLSASLTATFSKDMNPATLNASTFSLKDHLSVGVPGLLDYNPSTRTATFSPDVDLAWGETYTATITTGITDTDDLALQAAKTWTFTTRQAVYPTILYTNPTDGGLGASVVGTVQAVFSESVSGITAAGIFTLKDGANNPVAGTVSYDATSRTATFTPSSPLEYYNPLVAGSGQYSATITTAVTDADGLAMQAVKTWSFRTTELKQPTVISTSPAHNARGTGVDTVIRAVFSEEVTGVDGSSFTVRDDLTLLAVSGTVSTSDGGITYTFVPNAPLAFNRGYTFTIDRAAVTDSDGLHMPVTEENAWSFTTFGDFAEPTVTNNLVRPGSNDPVRIFIPQPPRGAQDRVTVLVFTATGKRVATLVSARRYQDILAELPIVWDTANGRGQRLGPGVYYIQITATDYKKVLKVMIVR